MSPGEPLVIGVSNDHDGELSMRCPLGKGACLAEAVYGLRAPRARHDPQAQAPPVPSSSAVPDDLALRLTSEALFSHAFVRRHWT
jgi:hypothetical protein